MQSGRWGVAREGLDLSREELQSRESCSRVRGVPLPSQFSPAFAGSSEPKPPDHRRKRPNVPCIREWTSGPEMASSGPDFQLHRRLRQAESDGFLLERGWLFDGLGRLA